MALFPLSALNEIGLESPSCLMSAHLLGFSKGADTGAKYTAEQRLEKIQKERESGFYSADLD